VSLLVPLLLIGGTTAVVELVTAVRASATSCTSAPTDNFKRGWDTEQHIANGGSEPNPPGIEGISSYIYTRVADAWCASDLTFNNFSSSWNIVQDDYGHFAQAGTIVEVTDTGCTYAFAEQWIPTGTHDAWYQSTNCLTVGVKHAYRNLMVRQSDGSYRVQSSVDGVSKLSGNYDPFGYWTSQYYGFDVGFTSEQQYSTTAAEGNFSVEVNYTAMGFQHYTDDTQSSACGIVFARFQENNPPHTFTGDQDCSDVSTWESGL
jgi:hypothetical protein